MEFEGNADLTQESTENFISLLSAQLKVEIIASQPAVDRIPPVVVDGKAISVWNLAKESVRQTALEFSRILLLSPMINRDSRLDAARREALRRKAELVVLGTITSTGENLGRDCVSTVSIYDAATGTEVAVFRARYNKLWTFSSRPVARKAVALTAEATLALLR